MARRQRPFIAWVSGYGRAARVSFDTSAADKDFAVILLLVLDPLRQAFGGQLCCFGAEKAAKSPGCLLRLVTIHIFR
jgi:hypothetical protein